jgi:hypothetical protein
MVSPTFDSAALTIVQRHGSACVVCHRRWPRPRIRVGQVACGTVVFACDDCAPVLSGRHQGPASLAARASGPAAAARL